MNKKSTMIFIVMLLAASAAGLVLLKYYERGISDEPVEPDNVSAPGEPVAASCENLTGDEKAKCYFHSGDLNKSLEVCDNMSMEDRNVCYQKIAVAISGENVSNLNESFGLCNNMTSGRFMCYTALASVVVASDADAAISLCDLTSPSYLCYSSIGYAIGRRGVNEAAAVCGKTNDSSCYAPAAVFIAKNDSEGAVFLCRECVNATDTECPDCYFGVAKTVAHYDSKKALDVCTEAAAVAGKYSGSFPYMCQMDAAEAIAEINASASFEICGNLTGRNEASCYYRIMRFSNDTAQLTEMCGRMIAEYGEDPNIMRYCENYA